MPKVKHFKNPLKFCNGHVSSSTIRVSQDILEAPTNSSQAHEVSQQEQAPNQPQQEKALNLPQQEQASIPRQQEQAPNSLHHKQAPILPSNLSRTSVHPRTSAGYWRVKTIDSENAIKQINVKVNEVNNLTVEEHIIIDFDQYNAPYGDAQALLARYCGSLVIDCNFFPISFDRWSGQSGLPKKYMEDFFEIILKPRFLFRVRESIAYIYYNSSIAKKWATHRQRLWDEFSDTASSRSEIISNVPSGINKDQWASFVAYRQKPSTIELCRRNKENQKKQKMPHTGG